ncbi:hypothetical protein EJ03DRAFT_58384 [Teratosphaeria nubilosa]|uniref:Uncharacterized protein n=1 Tax=Teratosphaeria nubilosa TaxID=161662 RepID=A0A6G1KUD5_9PEZI|nr:hypothetical protein EJ03DRAFT_58384 [Teratosphaeria nubilosa]
MFERTLQPALASGNVIHAAPWWLYTSLQISHLANHSSAAAASPNQMPQTRIYVAAIPQPRSTSRGIRAIGRKDGRGRYFHLRGRERRETHRE